MKKPLKVIIFSTIAVGVLIGAGWCLADFMDMNTESARLLSLGQAKPSTQPKEEQSVLFNDPAIKNNWGLLDKQSGIQAAKAWEIQKGSKNIVVAIIDTGIDANHPDLKNNLWVNPGESGLDANGRDKATNGIDDDKNGFVDDVHGWNFVASSNDLTDNHGHGTHIAGIIGAEGGNGIGISGVCPHVSLMVLKYYDPKSNGNNNLKNTIRAIEYATRMGARVINYSGGGLDFSNDEYAAIKAARDKGVLFVAAAGNEKSNSDLAHFYPADYDLDNIISVTAINTNTEVLSSSNFGLKTVHIAAPGEAIFSTLPGGEYGTMTGTSQATAFPTGVAALLFANNSSYTYQDVKKQILATADEEPSLRGRTKTSGKLNSWAALAIQPSQANISGVVVKTKAPVVTIEKNEDGFDQQLNNISQISQILNLARTPAQKQN